jgi:hypothetical protein
MCIRSWFKHDLDKYTDKDPVSGNTQLSHQTEANVHENFVIDMLDRGMPIDQVPLLPAFKAIWKKEFKNVTIRKYKTVDSKDQVRCNTFNVYLNCTSQSQPIRPNAICTGTRTDQSTPFGSKQQQ